MLRTSGGVKSTWLVLTYWSPFFSLFFSLPVSKWSLIGGRKPQGSITHFLQTPNESSLTKAPILLLYQISKTLSILFSRISRISQEILKREKRKERTGGLLDGSIPKGA